MATTAAPANTIGIDVTGINKITEALDAYKSDVKSKTDISANSKKIAAAIKGTASEAAFVSAAKELQGSVEDLLNFVDKFKKTLESLEQTYKAHDESVTYNFKE